MINKMTLAATAGLALVLGACADDDMDEADMADADAEMTDMAPEDADPMARQYELTDEQQARMDEYDMDSFQTEYAGYRDDMMANSGSEQMSADNSDGEMQSSDDMDNSSMAWNRTSMTWADLDRNSDGQLSVAEYAVWAVPVDGDRPKANDELKPYLSAEQANAAATSFFYYDMDGDSYLSESEFQTARTGGTPSAMTTSG